MSKSTTVLKMVYALIPKKKDRKSMSKFEKESMAITNAL